MIHRIRRFFATLTARTLSESELGQIAGWLDNDDLLTAFREQPATDQRHALRCGAFVAAETDRVDLIQAAVLHDVGKRHVGFGVVRRSLAGIMDVLRVAPTGSFRLYNTHGPIGADELSSLGAPALVIDFARSHHALRPDTISAEDWALLQASDNER